MNLATAASFAHGICAAMQRTRFQRSNTPAVDLGLLNYFLLAQYLRISIGDKSLAMGPPSGKILLTSSNVANELGRPACAVLFRRVWQIGSQYDDIMLRQAGAGILF